MKYLEPLFFVLCFLVTAILFLGSLLNWRYKRGYWLLVLSFVSIAYIEVNWIGIELGLYSTKIIFILCGINIILVLISLWLTFHQHSMPPKLKTKWKQILLGYIGIIFAGLISLLLLYSLCVEIKNFCNKDTTLKIEECKYKTSQDLSDISGVNIPEVKLIKANSKEAFGMWCDYMDFIIVEKRGQKKLIKSIKEEINKNEFSCWRETADGFEFFTQGPNAAGDYFTEINIKEATDTIHVRYGWAR